MTREDYKNLKSGDYVFTFDDHQSNGLGINVYKFYNFQGDCGSMHSIDNESVHIYYEDFFRLTDESIKLISERLEVMDPIRIIQSHFQNKLELNAVLESYENSIELGYYGIDETTCSGTYALELPFDFDFHDRPKVRLYNTKVEIEGYLNDEDHTYYTYMKFKKRINVRKSFKEVLTAFAEVLKNNEYEIKHELVYE